MNIYKLKYADKETAIADLIAKNVVKIIEEVQIYINGTHAVVECGIIVLTSGFDHLTLVKSFLTMSMTFSFSIHHPQPCNIIPFSSTPSCHYHSCNLSFEYI